MRVVKQYPQISYLLIFSIGLFIFGICLALIDSIFMYDNRKSRQYLEIKNELPPSSPLPFVSPPKIDSVGTTRVIFNEDANQTTAQTPLMIVYSNGLNQIELQARFTSTGERIIKPKNFLLAINVMTIDKEALSDRTFKIFLDGKLAFTKLNKANDKYSGEEVFTASMNKELPFRLFVKITRAKKVEMQIGSKIIKLTPNDLQTFRDLLNTL